MLNIVPTQVDKNARQISQSQRLRGTLPKPRRRQLALVLLYNTTIVYINDTFGVTKRSKKIAFYF